MAFHVGDLAVCIRTMDYEVQGKRVPYYGPQLGDVRRVVGKIRWYEKTFLQFDEYRNAAGFLAGYNQAYFRPVKTTDLDVFRELLKPVPENQGVDA